MRAWTFVAASLAFDLCGLAAHRPVSAQVVVAMRGTAAPTGVDEIHRETNATAMSATTSHALPDNYPDLFHD
jgi:hypothetical protein